MPPDVATTPAAARVPYVYRGGTPIDPETAESVWADGPDGRALHGFLDARRGVYQTVGKGWNDFHLATRQVTVPTDAWNRVWDQAGRIEFVDHADNRVLVVDVDVARREGVEVASPVGPLVAIPIACCRLWKPPVDAVADQPVVGRLTPAEPGVGLEAAVDGVDAVAARPVGAPGRILLDAGPSERGWHHAETMLRCPQLYAYRYLLRTFNVTTRLPLIKGSLVHIGLAHLYARMQAKQLREDPDRYFDPETAIRLLAGRYGGKWEAWIPLAVEVTNAYAHYYTVDNVRVVAVEEQLRTTIAGHTFTQRADLILGMPDGSVRIFDHKTTSRLSKDTIDRYTLSGQFLGLRHFGPLIYGDKFSGVRVNFAALTGKAARYRFRREAPAAAPHAMACFPQAIVDAEADIRRMIDSGRDPWFWPKRLNEQVCNTIYGECEGAPWCQWGRGQIPEEGA